MRVRCRIVRKDVEFSVEPQWNKWDLKAETTLKIGGVDHATEFRFRRWRREWEADIDHTKIDVRTTDSPGQTGSYPQVGAWRLNKDWTEEKENTEAIGKITADFPPPVDPLPPPGEPPNWPARRWIVEYLVAVEDFPELGYLYHFVVLETTPLGHYDGYLHRSFAVQPQEWCKVKNEPQPIGGIYTKGAKKFTGGFWVDKEAVDAARRRLWPPWQKDKPYTDPNEPWYRWGDE